MELLSSQECSTSIPHLTKKPTGGGESIDVFRATPALTAWISCVPTAASPFAKPPSGVFYWPNTEIHKDFIISLYGFYLGLVG